MRCRVGARGASAAGSRAARLCALPVLAIIVAVLMPSFASAGDVGRIAASRSFVGYVTGGGAGPSGYPEISIASDASGRSLTRFDYWVTLCDPRHPTYRQTIEDSGVPLQPGPHGPTVSYRSNVQIGPDPSSVTIEIRFTSPVSAVGSISVSTEDKGALPPVTPFCGYGVPFRIRVVPVRIAPYHVRYPALRPLVSHRTEASTLLPVGFPAKFPRPVNNGQLVIFEAHVGNACSADGPLAYLRVSGRNQGGKYVSWTARDPGSLNDWLVGDGNPLRDYLRYWWWKGTISVSFRYADGYANTIQAYVPPISDVTQPAPYDSTLREYDWAGPGQVYVTCAGTLKYETVTGLPRSAGAGLICTLASGEVARGVVAPAYTGFTMIGATPNDDYGFDVIGGFGGQGYAAVLPRIITAVNRRQIVCLLNGSAEPGTEGSGKVAPSDGEEVP